MFVIFSLVSFRDKQPQNSYGASNSADLLLCRALGLFNLSAQDHFLASSPMICQAHINELLTNWAVGNKHFVRANNSQTKQKEASCSFVSNAFEEAESTFHTYQTNVTSNNLPRLSKVQAEFLLNHYGVFLHVGLRKFKTVSFLI